MANIPDIPSFFKFDTTGSPKSKYFAIGYTGNSVYDLKTAEIYLFGDVRPENVLLDLPTGTETDTQIQYPSIRGYTVAESSLTENKIYGGESAFYAATNTADTTAATPESAGYLLFQRENTETKLIAAFNAEKNQYAEAKSEEDETTLLLQWINDTTKNAEEYKIKQEAKNLYYNTLDSEYKKMKKIQEILNNDVTYSVLFGLVSDQQKPTLNLKPEFLQRSNPPEDGLVELTEYKTAVVAYVTAIMTAFAGREAGFLTVNKDTLTKFVNSISALLALPNDTAIDGDTSDYTEKFTTYNTAGELTGFLASITNNTATINENIAQAATTSQETNTAERQLINSFIEGIDSQINSIPATNEVQTKLADAKTILDEQSTEQSKYTVAKSKKEAYDNINAITIGDDDAADYTELYTNITHPTLTLTMYTFADNQFTLNTDNTLQEGTETNPIQFNKASEFFTNVNKYYKVLEEESTYSATDDTNMKARFITKAQDKLAVLKTQAESAAKAAGNAYITEVNDKYTEFNTAIEGLNTQIDAINAETVTDVITNLYNNITAKKTEIDIYKGIVTTENISTTKDLITLEKIDEVFASFWTKLGSLSGLTNNTTLDDHIKEIEQAKELQTRKRAEQETQSREFADKLIQLNHVIQTTPYDNYMNQITGIDL